MTKPNFFDDVVDQTVQAMQDVVGYQDLLSDDVQPFDSLLTTPDEEDLIFDNPIAYFPGAVDPELGMPITNAQAAQMMLQKWGAQRYVEWVESVVERRDKEGFGG